LNKNPVLRCTDLGTMDNLYTSPKRSQPEPPEGFVDNTVKVFRLNPDGSKGEFLGTMPAFPEGWDHPQQFREKGFQKKKEEVKEMPKKDIDFGVIVARAQEVAAERGISLYKASGIVAQETGLHRTTVYNHARAMLQAPSPEPAEAANQEPERESQESAVTSVAQEEPEITAEEDVTLDELKIAWIDLTLGAALDPSDKVLIIEKLAGIAI
jgi:hypothetical protein